MKTPGEASHHFGAAPAAAPANGCAAGLRAPDEPGASVAACVLLAGGLKPSALTAGSGLSVLDFPIGPRTTLLDHWIRCLGPLVRGGTPAGIRVIHCDGTPPPGAPTLPTAVPVSTRQDVQRYRGPAGVARDVCEDLPGEAQVLIAEGARFPACDLEPLAADHARTGADITVAANPDGSPAGIYIARRATFDIVPQRGFMDLKEQWLSRAIGRGFVARVFSLHPPGALPLRTRVQLLRACFTGRPETPASPWFSQGVTRGVLVRGRVSNVIVAGAAIDPAALLAHTIAMPGSQVAAGAVVARSILCPGARVGPGQEIIDAIVTADGVRLDSDDAPRRGKERAR